MTRELSALQVMAQMLQDSLRRVSETQYGQAESDARLLGAGWLKVHPNGKVERIDPETIFVYTEEAKSD